MAPPANRKAPAQPNTAQNPAVTPSETEDPRINGDTASQFQQKELLDRAYAVLTSLRDENYLTLSSLVHPSKGVTFTPYSTVDLDSNITLYAADLTKARQDTATYTWGLQDGSGELIQMTITDYFSRYVYNADFTLAPQLGINTTLSNGNALENVEEAYPNAYYIEVFYPGFSPKNEGLDWCGLKLVFEPVDQTYMLVGIVHSEWTV